MDKYKEKLFELIRKDQKGIPLTEEDYFHLTTVLVRNNPYNSDTNDKKTHITIVEDPHANMAYMTNVNCLRVSKEYVDDAKKGEFPLEDYILTTMHERRHIKQKIEMEKSANSESLTDYQRALKLDHKNVTQNDALIDGKLSSFYITFKDYFRSVWDIASDEQKEELLDTVKYCLYYQEFGELDANSGSITDMRELLDSIVSDEEAPEDVKSWAKDKYKFLDSEEEEFKINERTTKEYVDDFFGMEIDEFVDGVGARLERAEGKPTYEGVCRRTSGALKIMLANKDLYFNLLCYQYSLKHPRKIEKDGKVEYKKNDLLNDALRVDIAEKVENIPQEKKEQLSKAMCRFGIKNEGVEFGDIEMFLTEEDKAKYLAAKPPIGQVKEDVDEM